MRKLPVALLFATFAVLAASAAGQMECAFPGCPQGSDGDGTSKGDCCRLFGGF